MIYIVNFDMLQKDINIIKQDNYEYLEMDCLGYTKKRANFMALEIVDSSVYNTLTKNRRKYIIKDAYIIDLKTLDMIFKRYRKTIYLINVSVNQEKHIYKKFKGKYKYYRCQFDVNKDNFFFYLKKLIFLKENRMKLMNKESIHKLNYIIKYIGYNLPYTDLEDNSLLHNFELLMDLDKYKFTNNAKSIFGLLLTNFKVPNFSYTLKTPPKVIKKKTKKKEIEYKKIDVRIAADNMPDYFKNRDNIFTKEIKLSRGGLL